LFGNNTRKKFSYKGGVIGLLALTCLFPTASEQEMMTQWEKGEKPVSNNILFSSEKSLQ